MAMVFRFRMLSDENDNFLRDYEVGYDTDLLEFHRYISSQLGYDESAGASFFLSDRQWEKLDEYTLFDMGDGLPEAPMPMDSVTLGKLMRQNGDRLIYVFDLFGDRALYLELTGTFKEADGVDYPRVVKEEADPPGQFEAGGEESGSIFDEALGEFGSFEGDDYYDEEY